MRKVFLPLFLMLLVLLGNSVIVNGEMTVITSQPANEVDLDEFTSPTGSANYSVTLTFSPTYREFLYLYVDSDYAYIEEVETWVPNIPIISPSTPVLIETFDGILFDTRANVLLTEDDTYSLEVLDLTYATGFIYYEITFKSFIGYPGTSSEWLTDLKEDLYVSSNHYYWNGSIVSEIQQAYVNGYEDGQDDMYQFGSGRFGYDNTLSLDYANGYTSGHAVGLEDMFTNGSEVYDYTVINAFDYNVAVDDTENDIYDNGYSGDLPVNASYDFLNGSDYGYEVGFDEGSATNVDIGMNVFMQEFSSWIVPAIVVVILLGGFMTMAVTKRRGD